MNDEPAVNLDRMPTMIVGVAGPWRDLDGVFSALVDSGDGRYLAKEMGDEAPGYVGLLDKETGWISGCTLNPRNPALVDGFALLGPRRYNRKDRAAVDSHQTILLLTADGGSMENARGMLAAVAAAIRAGGVAAIVESTGIGHMADDWLSLAQDDPEKIGGVYWAFVRTIGPRNRRTYYTCGMHNLGYRDAISDAFPDAQTAAMVLNSFHGFLLQSGQLVADGDVLGEESNPEYRLIHEPCRLYSPDDPFFNPFGMWRLVPA